MTATRQTKAARASSRFSQLPTSKHPEIRKGIAAVKQLVGQRKYREAGDLLNRMLSIEPRNAELHFLTAIASESAGLSQQAINAYKQTVGLAPDFLPALVNGAAMLADDLRPLEALRLYRRAMTIAPSEQVVRQNIAVTLADLRRRQEVVQHRAWLARKFPGLDSKLALAEAFDLAGQTDDARRTFIEALGMGKGQPEICVFIATLEMTRGNADAARDWVAKALDYSPGNGHARLLQARLLKKGQDVSTELEATRSFLPGSYGRSATDRSALYSGFALMTQAAGDYDAAFDAFCQSAALSNRDAERDVKREVVVREQANVLSKWIKENPGELGSDSKKPVFVTGMPRSGTTLIEQILSAHSQISGAGELELVQYLVNSLQPLSKQRNIECANAYLEADALRLSKSPRVVDKSLSTWEHVGAVLAMFPNARIIDCQRHPMDVCWSAFTELFTDNALIYTYDFNRLANAYKRHEELMQFWLREAPQNIIRVRYEHVIANPREQSQRLVSFIGLEWEEACLDFMNARSEVRTASMLQVRQPIYSSSISKWKRYEKHLAPLADLLKNEIAAYEAGN
jgi:tetratricopeptide (TPR) repeat protein